MQFLMVPLYLAREELKSYVGVDRKVDIEIKNDTISSNYRSSVNRVCSEFCISHTTEVRIREGNMKS